MVYRYLHFHHSKKGISSIQLGKDLGITQKSAWFVLSRLRNNFQPEKDLVLTGTVEADETFVGGKNKNRHENKKVKNSQGRAAIDKTPVLGLVQREVSEYRERPHKVIAGKMVKEKVVLQPSKVVCHVIPNTDASTLHSIIYSTVHQDSRLITDAYRSYNGLGNVYAHNTIKHTEGNYQTEGDTHTNNIEGFWSHLKRGISGIYHNVSPKHLNKYCDEFAYRYNNRNISNADKFTVSLLRAEKRLTYNELIAK